MERREDIRAAMQGLLSHGKRAEATAHCAAPAPNDEPVPVHGGNGAITLSENQMHMVAELQAALRENGITATSTEILQALLDALAVRPAVCRGLLAAYLLNE